MRFFVLFAVANSLLVATGAAAFGGRSLLSVALAPVALLALAVVVWVVAATPPPRAAAGARGELRRAVQDAKRRHR